MEREKERELKLRVISFYKNFSNISFIPDLCNTLIIRYQDEGKVKMNRNENTECKKKKDLSFSKVGKLGKI